MSLPSLSEVQQLLVIIKSNDLPGLEEWTHRTNALLAVDEASPLPLLWEAVRRGGLRIVPFLLSQGCRHDEKLDGHSLTDMIVERFLQHQHLDLQAMHPALSALLNAGVPLGMCKGWSAATLGLLVNHEQEMELLPGRAWSILDAVMSHPSGWSPTAIQAMQAWEEWVQVVSDASDRELLTFPLERDWLKSANGKRWCTTLFKACPLEELLSANPAWSRLLAKSRSLTELAATIQAGAEHAQLALGLEASIGSPAPAPERRRI